MIYRGAPPPILECMLLEQLYQNNDNSSRCRYFRDDHIRSQSNFIIERKAHRGWRQWLPERYGKGVYPFGVSEHSDSSFFATQKGRVEIHDENVVICKDCFQDLF